MISICCILRTLVWAYVWLCLHVKGGCAGSLEGVHVGEGLWLSTLLTLALVVQRMLVSVPNGARVSGNSYCISWCELGQLQRAFVFLSRIPHACCYRNVCFFMPASALRWRQGFPVLQMVGLVTVIVFLSFSCVCFAYFMEYIFFFTYSTKGDKQGCNSCLLNTTLVRPPFFFLNFWRTQKVDRFKMHNFPVK